MISQIIRNQSILLLYSSLCYLVPLELSFGIQQSSAHTAHVHKAKMKVLTKPRDLVFLASFPSSVLSVITQHHDKWPMCSSVQWAGKTSSHSRPLCMLLVSHSSGRCLQSLFLSSQLLPCHRRQQGLPQSSYYFYRVLCSSHLCHINWFSMVCHFIPVNPFSLF